MTPNIENIRKWVAALRDPAAKQTREVLCRVDTKGNITGECCLGVACRLARTPFVFVVGKRLRMYGGDTDLLPPNAQEWLGVDSHSPYLKIPLHLQEKAEGWTKAMAVSLNDEYGFTFREIAECIEETWPEVRQRDAEKRKMQAFVEAARELRKQVTPHLPEELPTRSHTGVCGPEAGCDGDCSDLYCALQHNNRIRAFDAADKALRESEGG